MSGRSRSSRCTSTRSTNRQIVPLSRITAMTASTEVTFRPRLSWATLFDRDGNCTAGTSVCWLCPPADSRRYDRLMRPSPSRFLVAVACTFFFTARLLASGNMPINVILDRGSFYPETYSLFQAIANQVVAQVNLLIPGTPPDVSEDDIVCFETNPTFEASSGHSGPIVLIGPKLAGEPAATSAGTIRIAVNAVQPGFLQRFAFQLSHELAHVKMGPQIDNALIETFATATSYEVMRRLGYNDYVKLAISADLELLPPEIQVQLSSGETEPLRKYWQSQIVIEWNRMDDRPMQTLGALLLKMGDEPRWELLLGISAFSHCADSPSRWPVKLCPPDVKKIAQVGLSLKSLGY